MLRYAIHAGILPQTLYYEMLGAVNRKSMLGHFRSARFSNQSAHLNVHLAASIIWKAIPVLQELNYLFLAKIGVRGVYIDA